MDLINWRTLKENEVRILDQRSKNGVKEEKKKFEKNGHQGLFKYYLDFFPVTYQTIGINTTPGNFHMGIRWW